MRWVFLTGSPWRYLPNDPPSWEAVYQQSQRWIAAGVFDRFPRLRIVLAEGGFAWSPSLMWRMDRSYQLFREDLPSLQRLPSEYVREHFWFTTQPIDEPEKPEYFMQTLELLEMNDRFLFATDYPHWDFDAPDRVFPRGVGDELKQMMYHRNALEAFSKVRQRHASVANS